jgi:hypothetical protein
MYCVPAGVSLRVLLNAILESQIVIDTSAPATDTAEPPTSHRPSNIRDVPAFDIRDLSVQNP